LLHIPIHTKENKNTTNLTFTVHESSISSFGKVEIESEDSDESSSSSCSFVEVTGVIPKNIPQVVPMYGKQFQVLGHDNDDDNTDSDDSEAGDFSSTKEVKNSTNSSGSGLNLKQLVSNDKDSSIID